MRKENYKDGISQINEKGFNMSVVREKEREFYSGHSLEVKKKNDSFSTFDDGLLF